MGKNRTLTVEGVGESENPATCFAPDADAYSSIVEMYQARTASSLHPSMAPLLSRDKPA